MTLRTIALIFISVSIHSDFLYSQKDTEFWFAAPETSQGSVNYDRPTVFRFVTYELPATIIITQPANPLFPPQAISIPANSAGSIAFPPLFEHVENTPPNQILNKGFYISSNSSISAYYELIGTPPNNPEIFSLKGKNALGISFFVPFQTVANNTTTFIPQPYATFDIVATEDNTSITITPTTSIVGSGANTPKTIFLNKGQTYSAQSVGVNANQHPSGSKVISSKPIAITIKDDLLDGGLLYGNFCRDLIGTQIVPVEKTGTQYVVQKGFLNGDEYVFVVATESNTQVFMDGVSFGTINSGESKTLSITNGSHFIETTERSYVLQMTGIGCELAGEILPALNCSGSTSVGFVRSTNESFYLFLVTESGKESNFTLNGNPNLIQPNAFQLVPGSNNKYVAAIIPIAATDISAGQSAIVENSIGQFQMGLLNGTGSGTGCRYGYFSDFGNLTPISAPLTLCPSGSVFINGIEYTQPGVVYDTLPGIQGCDTLVTYTISLAPYDFVIHIGDVRCVDGRIDLDYTVCNLGSDNLPPILSLAFYDNDPSLHPSTLLGTIDLDTGGADSCYTGTLQDAGNVLGLTNGMGVYAVVNDNGTLPTPFPMGSFPPTGIDECAYYNNFDSTEVQLPNGPTLDLGPDVVLCQDSTVVFDAGPGFISYLWQDNSIAQTLAAMNAGIYWVEVVDSCGNTQRDSVLFTVSLLGDIKLADTTLCAGNAYIISVPGFDSYTWAPATGLSCTDCATVTIQPDVTTTYTFFATTVDGCVQADTFTVTVISTGPNLNLGPDVVLCEDSTVVFDAGPGYAFYLWQDGSNGQTFAASNSGIYWVEVADSCGISQRDTVLLTVSLLGDVKLADTSLCAGDAITLSVPGFDTYIWAPAAGLSCTDCATVTVQPDATTTYTLFASTADGCTKADTFSVEIIPLPMFSDTIEFCPGESVTIGGQTYTQPAVLMDTIPDPNGCDIVATYVLKFVTAPNSSISIDCIEDINIATLAGTGSIPVDYDLPTFFTDCPCPGVELTLTEGLPPGSLFPVDKTKVCYEARDSCGNVDTCCFNIIVREALPCDVKEIGCMRYELLRISQNSAGQRSYRIRVINNCPAPMIYTAFELPDGTKAVAPPDNSIYTSPDNRDYQVRNPNFSPFYSIRFKSTTDSISNGESDIFTYTLPPQSEPVYIHVTSRLFPQQFFEAYLNTFNCPVQPENKPQAIAKGTGLRVFPNPTSGNLYVDLSDWTGEQVQLRVVGATGQELQVLQLTADAAPQEVQVPRHLPEGLYFLEIQTAKGVKQTVRFVVQR